MMSEEKQEILVRLFEKRFQDYNDHVLKELGNVIKQFKGLSPSEAHKLAQQLKYSTNIKDLLNELSKITGLSIKDLKKILEKTAKDNLKFADTYYKARNIETPVYEENKALQRLVNSVYNITGKEFKNIAKSTGFRLLDAKGNPMLLDIDKTYKEVIDRCVIAISQGQETYQQAMRDTVKQLSMSGVRRIDYKSGYSRRLDSTVRMNILDSIRQISNESQRLFGEEFDSNGVEISVHLNPAEDHSNVQGHQFSNEEYEKLQSTGVATDYNGEVIDIRIKDNFRPISTLNCYHVTFAIVLGVSNPQYSKEQLQEIIDKNNEGFNFGGRHFTYYQGEMAQRLIERNIRYAKEEQILAKASGDEDLILKSQTRISQLTTKYKQLVQASRLPNRLSTRASVSGYRRLNVNRINSIEIEYARKNNTIWHSTENLKEIINDDKLLAPSIAVGKKLNGKVKYGSQFIEFKPEILEKVKESTVLYQGDGGNTFSQKSGKFKNLMEMLKDNPKNYNELKFDDNIEFFKYIKKVYIRQDELKEIINLLKKYKIDYEIYNDYRERGFTKKNIKK